ncbi:MAG: hypothetical protein FWF02_14860 [Micrococcales bacterium]|nr:hypothetical protein [Micrococcales bacterium]MCL2668959.1 hypothetical protein [Micrococcales bacterium]
MRSPAAQDRASTEPSALTRLARTLAERRWDRVILAYADRYATDQYESYVPTTLGRAHMVASGGIASKVASRSAAVRAATEIVPVGLVGDERGRPLNVADFELPRLSPQAGRPRTIAVFGTAMNAGKTTTIHHMLHGLAKAGAQPGAAKVTGTGSGNDFWVMLDAGAHRMYDFTDVGLASSFNHRVERLEDAAEQLVAHLTNDGCRVNFLEIADGVLQQENQHLIRSPRLHALVDTVVFAASDAMGAVHGVQTLRDNGFDVAAVCGTLTRSPLAVREAREALGLPVLGLEEIVDPRIMGPLLGIDTSALVMPNDEPDPWQIIVPGLVGADGIVHGDEDEPDPDAPAAAPATPATKAAALAAALAAFVPVVPGSLTPSGKRGLSATTSCPTGEMPVMAQAGSATPGA